MDLFGSCLKEYLCAWNFINEVGCYHFQNATVNRCNSKSISKLKGQLCRERERRRRRPRRLFVGPHQNRSVLIFLSLLDLCISAFLFILPCYKPSPFPFIFAPSMGTKLKRGGLSLQNVTSANKGATHASIFLTHCQLPLFFMYLDVCAVPCLQTISFFVPRLYTSFCITISYIKFKYITQVLEQWLNVFL